MQVKVIEQEKKKPSKLKVCAYVRVSTDSFEQEDSLENQASYFRRFIIANPDWEFAGIYADQGITGYVENRPQFQSMLQNARDGNIDLIVVKSVSRFARNTETVLKYSREMKSIGVGIFFQLQNINTLTEAGELMLTILAAFAQAESESNSGNVRITIRNKFKNGIPNFPVWAMYGYTKNDAGDPMIDEETARVVHTIFDLAERGIWVSKIAKYLTESGIPAPKGGSWQQSTVRRILGNEAYIGDRILQKRYNDGFRKTKVNHGEVDMWEVKNAHPAIVDRKQWKTVQDVLEKRNEDYLHQPPPEKVKHDTHSRYPLSNMLYCPHCGSKLIHKWDGKQKYEYWMCSTKYKVGHDLCPGVLVPDRLLEGWDAIKEPVVVVPYEDKYGMKHYTAYPKAEYEIEHGYPNKYIKSEKPQKENPKRRNKVTRKHETQSEHRYTRKKYKHSHKLYCPYCGATLSHKWDDDVPYWVCSTNRNWHRDKSRGERCKGLYLPAEISDEWGDIDEPVTVIPFWDDVGNRFFTYMNKEEYEASEDCPYRKEKKDG